MMTNKSIFKCTGCGNDGMPIQRRESSQRKHGHLKDLYCVQCKRTTRHVEDRNNSFYKTADEVSECNTCSIRNARSGGKSEPLCGEECKIFKVIREVNLEGKVFPEEEE